MLNPQKIQDALDIAEKAELNDIIQLIDKWTTAAEKTPMDQNEVESIEEEIYNKVSDHHEKQQNLVDGLNLGINKLHSELAQQESYLETAVDQLQGYGNILYLFE